MMDKRFRYGEKLSAQTFEWDEQIDLLKDKAGNATAGEKFDYWLAGSILQHKRNRAAEMICALAMSRKTHWEKLKPEAEKSRRDRRNFLRAFAME